MKKVLLLIAVVSLFSACRGRRGSGNIITEKRTVSDFKGVEAGGGFEVELITGPEYKVEIAADDNLMSLIETRVSGGILEIDTKSSIRNGQLKVMVTAPEFSTIKASGAASIKGANPLKCAGKLIVDASGASHIEAEVDAPAVESEASGASHIELKGRTKAHEADASGSATIKASNLKSETADASASGAASAHVFGSVSVEGEASGAGSVFYSGGGPITSHVSGAGSVKPE